MVSKGHRKAGKTGSGWEKSVANMLNDVGFVEIDKKNIDDSVLTKWYCRQYNKFHSVYGKIAAIDLLIFDLDHFPEKLAVELKYQASGGSVDEKFPFVILNLRRWFKRHGIKGALFLNGGKYCSEALSWVLSQQDENLFVVESYSDVYNWIEDNLS